MDSYKPTDAFRKLLSSISKKRESFFKTSTEEYEIEEINKTEDYFTYLAPDSHGETQEYKVSFKDQLRRELDKCLWLYKDGINIYLQRNDIKEEHYFQVQKKILEEIKVQYSRELVNYPFIEEYFNRSERHLWRLTQPGNDHYLNDTSSLSPREKVTAIFSYLKGENEKGEKIMADEEYSRLVQMVFHLVEKKEVPPDERPIGNIQITNELLQLTFWVLHKELYTTKEIKGYFIDFLKDKFVAFEKSPDSLRSRFGRKSKVYPHDFIPIIIKKYLQ